MPVRIAVYESAATLPALPAAEAAVSVKSDCGKHHKLTNYLNRYKMPSWPAKKSRSNGLAAATRT